MHGRALHVPHDINEKVEQLSRIDRLLPLPQPRGLRRSASSRTSTPDDIVSNNDGMSCLHFTCSFAVSDLTSYAVVKIINTITNVTEMGFRGKIRLFRVLSYMSSSHFAFHV